VSTRVDGKKTAPAEAGGKTPAHKKSCSIVEFRQRIVKSLQLLRKQSTSYSASRSNSSLAIPTKHGHARNASEKSSQIANFAHSNLSRCSRHHKQAPNTMKIDTKKAATVNKEDKECKIVENKFISPIKMEESKGDSLGRELTYIPTVLFTPVLTSKRLASTTSKSPEPHVHPNDLTELCSKLSKLFVKEDEEEEKKSEVGVNTTEEEMPTSKERLGRFKTTFMNPKKMVEINVTRSARLVSAK
jgi:hypothetical protein